MKLPSFPARPQLPADVKPVERQGPTLLEPEFFKHVGGGSPKGTWQEAAALKPMSPKGTW